MTHSHKSELKLLPVEDVRRVEREHLKCARIRLVETFIQSELQHRVSHEVKLSLTQGHKGDSSRLNPCGI